MGAWLPDGGTRVLFLSHWFPRSHGDWGGVFILEQAKALRKAGIDVRVLAAEPMPSIAWRSPFAIARGLSDLLRMPLPPWRDMAGVPVAYVPFLTPHPRLWGALAPRCYIASLNRWRSLLLAGFTPDVVHAHTAFLDGYAGAWLARKLAVPLIVTEGTGPFSTVMQTPAQRRLTTAAVNAADFLLPVSSFQLRTISEAIALERPSAARILGNGFDPELFTPTPMPADAHRSFLWIGRLDDNKQAVLLLEAFAIALGHDPNLRLTMIGAGPLEDRVRSMIRIEPLAGKVLLKPFVARPEIAAAMREHGTLVISSRVETFGVVGIEALGSGRNLLTTRCGGPEETVVAAEAGLVVDDSAEALASGMLRSVEVARRLDPDHTAAAARRLFSYETIAKALTALYGEVRSRAST